MNPKRTCNLATMILFMAVILIQLIYPSGTVNALAQAAVEPKLVYHYIDVSPLSVLPAVINPAPMNHANNVSLNGTCQLDGNRLITVTVSNDDNHKMTISNTSPSPISGLTSGTQINGNNSKSGTFVVNGAAGTVNVSVTGTWSDGYGPRTDTGSKNFSSACAKPTNTPTNTATRTPTLTATATSTNTPTRTPTIAYTPTSTFTDVPKKVYVCKYVGTPGSDEHLQSGQNPIEVSVNAIPGPVVIGGYFADSQGRSYVLGYVPMSPEPTSESCPTGDPTQTPTPTATFTQTPTVTYTATFTPTVTFTSTPDLLTPAIGYSPFCEVKDGVASMGLNITTLTGYLLQIDGGATYGGTGLVALSAGSHSLAWFTLPGYTPNNGTGMVDVSDCTQENTSTPTSTLEYTATPTSTLENTATPTSTAVFTSTPTNTLIYSPTPTGTTTVPTAGDPSVDIQCRLLEDGTSVHDVTISVAHAIIHTGLYGDITDSTILLSLPIGNYSWPWEAADGYVGSGTLSFKVEANCETTTTVIKTYWKGTCQTGNCGGDRWPTDSGPVTWQNNDQQGKDTPGILWVVVNDDCYVTPAGCIKLTYQYGESQVSAFTVKDRGKEYHSFESTGANGVKYNLFIGYTVTCFDKKNTSLDECLKALPDLPLPNGWTAINLSDDGYDVVPDVADTPIYLEMSCVLVPSYAWTVIKDGQAVAYNMPGSVDDSWIIWLMKTGLRPWPNTWPFDPKPGNWIWGKPPMDVTRAWATTLKQLKEWETLALPTK